MQLTKTILLAVFGLSATAFALPADAAIASAATPNVAADQPWCDRFRPNERPRECDFRGNCEHRDWNQRGRDCPRPRECERREHDRECGRWY